MPPAILTDISDKLWSLEELVENNEQVSEVAMKQAHPPVAVCTRCRTFTNDIQAINNRCGQRRDGRRCDGVYGSALNAAGDWEECRYCAGEGVRDGSDCVPCQGTGWGYIRGGHRY